MDQQQRSAVVHAFARIMKLDTYTARIHLSHPTWRLYRTGAIGKLQGYGQKLQSAGVPAFWVALSDVQAIRVFRVHYLSTLPQPSVVCQDEAGQWGSLAFQWSDIAASVAGKLPIFEDVVDLGAWNALKRREATQDYAQVLDLQLPSRNSILRFCDRTYQFQRGVDFAPSSDAIHRNPPTTRINWTNLLTFLHTTVEVAPQWSSFTRFAEAALEPLERIKNLPPHVDLLRKAETKWDLAFHLYSSLVLLKRSH